MIEDIARQQALFQRTSQRQSQRPRIAQPRQKSESPSAEKGRGGSGRTPATDPEISHLRERLEEALGTKVDIRKSGDQGKISITFFSAEELDGIIRKITGQAD